MYLKIKVDILHWIIYMYIRAFTILAFSITAFEIDIKIKDILFTIYFFLYTTFQRYINMVSNMMSLIVIHRRAFDFNCQF